MATLTRKQLLRTGAIGAAAAAALPATGSIGLSAPGGHLAIHIHGVVTGVVDPFMGLQVALSIDVAGQHKQTMPAITPLAGAGWDSGTTTATGMVPTANTATGPVGACYFTQAGELDGQIVSLEGTSLFTNRPLPLSDAEEPGRSDTRADGRSVTTRADLRTGEITWQLGTFVGRGKGVVVKIVG